jgi:MATE family multidrug resistance protein
VLPATSSTQATAPAGTIAEVLSLSWPIGISMIGHTLMGLVDTLMVAQVSEDAVGAVGLAHAVSLVPFCAGYGLLNGVRVAVAQATGAGNPKEARLAVREGVRIAALLGLLTLCLIPFSRSLMTLSGATGVALEDGTGWLAWRVVGYPFQFVAIAVLCGFDGRGETRLSMRVNTIANLVNIGLCMLLVTGELGFPALGTVGSAIATTLANLLQCGVAVWAWRRDLKRAGAHDEPVERASSPVARDTRRTILRIGGPTGFQWALEVVSWAVMSAFIVRFGPAQLAAHAIVSRIISMSFLPGHAIAEAGGILVGQAVGARDFEAARRSYRAAWQTALLLMMAFGAIFWTVPDLLTRAFEPSEGARLVSADLLIIAAFLQVFDATMLVSQSALNASGDSRFTMATGLGLAWLFWIPVTWYYTVHLGHGATAAWAGLLIHVTGTATILWLRWRSGVGLRRAISAGSPSSVAA